jgi:Tol biopolymer transport system component
MQYGILYFLSCEFLFSPLASSAWSAELPLIPMEDFFRNPEVASFSISPDGKKLAYKKPWKRRLNIYVRDIESGQERRLTSATDRDVAGFFWKGSDRIAFSQDKGGDENFHIFLVGIDGGDPKELTPFEGVKTYVLDDLEEDLRHLLISMNKNNPEVFDVYRCDLET